MRRLSSSWVSCVCVFVLFCSVVVVVALFVVGWQQHRSYRVIDAMVYSKNWRLEDKLDTGKTLTSVDWVWIRNQIYVYESVYFAILDVMEIVMTGVTWVLLSCMHGRIPEFGAYDILHELNKISFGWCLIIYFSSGRVTYSFWLHFWSQMWSGLGSIFFDPERMHFGLNIHTM